jgi:opacity protein-like surface antigen
MVGTGIEYMFAQNWSAKVEYNFLDLGSKSYVINDAPAFDIKSQIHEVKFGVNWHFWPL